MPWGESLPEKIRISSADKGSIDIPFEDFKQLDNECDEFYNSN